MELVDIINTVIQNNIKGMDLIDYRSGTVTSTEPIKVKVLENMPDIQEPFLIVPNLLKSKQISNLSSNLDITFEGETGTLRINSGSITVPSPLNIGDTVHLLKINNGQNFILLSN